MNGTQIGLISAGIGINLLFGTLYAIGVRHGSAHGHTDGYTALLVMIGVAFTLTINQACLYIPDDQLLDGALSLAGFTASGTPMSLEYFMRRAQQRIREEAASSDTATPPK